jgi:lysophospholipase L1-like esterase
MQFRTELVPTPAPVKIGRQSPVLLVGSCFADHIGARLAQAKFPAVVNPFGTIFNPISLVYLLETAWAGGELPEHLYAQRDGLHFHYWLPTTFATPKPAALRAQARDALAGVGAWLHQLAQPRFLLLTLGTAWAYDLPSGEPVANCHKMPASLFAKRLLTVEEISQNLLRLLRHLPTGIKVVLTVSPVRHLKDTLPLNTVSKASLLLACHQVTTQWPSANYFPAFELLTDDLRDYRFYAPDLLHPNEPAIDYIFDKFLATYLDAPAQAWVAKWAKLRAAMLHRPLHPGTSQHQRFLADLVRQLEAVTEADVSAEMAQVRQWLEAPMS